MRKKTTHPKPKLSTRKGTLATYGTAPCPVERIAVDRLRFYLPWDYVDVRIVGRDEVDRSRWAIDLLDHLVRYGATRYAETGVL